MQDREARLSVESCLWNCERKFRALKALSRAIQQGEGKQVFEDSDEDRLDFAILLEIIAEGGVEAAHEGWELSQQPTVA